MYLRYGAMPGKLFQADVLTFTTSVTLTVLLPHIARHSNNPIYLWCHAFAGTVAASLLLRCCFAAHIAATVAAARHTSMSSAPHEAHHKMSKIWCHDPPHLLPREKCSVPCSLIVLSCKVLLTDELRGQNLDGKCQHINTYHTYVDINLPHMRCRLMFLRI